MQNLDLLDRKIMYELDLNARISASQLAKKLRKSKETVNFRIKRLIEESYIKGFYTIFNTSKLGYYYYKVYIKLKNITPEKEKELFEYIQMQSHIAYLGSVEGHFDCIFLVMVKNSKDMTGFMIYFTKKFGEFIQEKEIHTVLAGHRLNQKFLFNGQSSKDSGFKEEIENYLLDNIDKKILEVISSSARTQIIEIAKQLKIDHKIIKYRLAKLEKNNIIVSYVTAPNFDKLGLQFIQINISLKDISIKNQIIQYFDSTSKCLFVLELLGRYDLSVEVHIENNKELRKIIDGFRSKFANICNDYDISTITKEYVVVWGPFSVSPA